MQIDKNIPIPPVQSAKGEVYPFKLMEVGDSFLVPFNNKTPRALQQYLAGKVNYHSSRYSLKFTTRIMPDGVRVWRVA